MRIGSVILRCDYKGRNKSSFQIITEYTCVRIYLRKYVFPYTFVAICQRICNACVR